jgi:hypothetical protein
MLREYDKWFLPYWNIFHEVTQDRRSHDPRQRQAVLPWRGRDHHRGGPPMLPSAPARTESFRVSVPPQEPRSSASLRSSGLDHNNAIGQVSRPNAPASSADGALLGLRLAHMKG